MNRMNCRSDCKRSRRPYICSARNLHIGTFPPCPWPEKPLKVFWSELSRHRRTEGRPKDQVLPKSSNVFNQTVLVENLLGICFSEACYKDSKSINQTEITLERKATDYSQIHRYSMDFNPFYQVCAIVLGSALLNFSHLFTL